MIQAESSLGHHLFQVPIAERIAQIPAKAQDNDLVLKVSPAKQCRPLVLHSFTLPECAQRGLRQILDKSQAYVRGPFNIALLRHRSSAMPTPRSPKHEGSGTAVLLGTWTENVTEPKMS